jgi:hypothetical protein
MRVGELLGTVDVDGGMNVKFEAGSGEQTLVEARQVYQVAGGGIVRGARSETACNVVMG